MSHRFIQPAASKRDKVLLFLAFASLLVMAVISAVVQAADPVTVTIGDRVIEIRDVTPATQPTTQPGDVIGLPPATQPADVITIDPPAAPTTKPTDVVTVEPATPNAQRGASGALKAIKLNGKPLRGNFELRDTLIDANGQSRVIDPAPGLTQKLINCKIVNGSVGRSVVEERIIFGPADKPYTLVMENVTTADTPGYTVYLEAYDTLGKPKPRMIDVTIKGCDIGSSFYETPVRLMPGVVGRIENCHIWDKVDLGANGKPTTPPNKANAAVRGHCDELVMVKADIGGYAKFGFTHYLDTKTVKLISVNFAGLGVEWEGKVAERVLQDCMLNGVPYR